MITQIITPNKNVQIVQGEEDIIFQKGMIIGIPNRKTGEIDKLPIKEVVFLSMPPSDSSKLVSITQQVYL
jgi:hypothetical protein